jgi:hypothetical protein
MCAEGNKTTKTPDYVVQKVSKITEAIDDLS